MWGRARFGAPNKAGITTTRGYRSLPVLGAARSERADAARNRRALLTAASAIVTEQGVAGLTMEAVATAAGVGVGTVYRRFGDRSGLAYALLDEREHAFQAAFMTGAPPLGPGAPPRERITAFLSAYVDRLADQGELLVAAETHAPGARYVSGAYAVQQRHLAVLIAEADSDADADYLADALLAALGSALFIHQRGHRAFAVDRIKAGVCALACGILADVHTQAGWGSAADTQ